MCCVRLQRGRVGEAEVHDLDVLVLVQEQVLGLHVPVHDALAFFFAAPRAVSFVLGEVPKLLLYTAIASTP